MTDRELLELAAKAAGKAGCYMERATGVGINQGPIGRLWNPLTDDGDALRLAVKLQFDIHCDGGEQGVLQGTHDGPMEFEECGEDQYAATRRAIVRAAASIGAQQ